MSQLTDPADHREHSSRHDPKRTDSAGNPWAGRSFDTNTFAGDDGKAAEPLMAALIGFRENNLGQSDVIEAVRDSRLLIPLIANAGDRGVDENGRQFEKTQELSLVTVGAPDGRLVLPVFSSTEAMARWNSHARPIPVTARRAALAAAAEDTPLMVLDPTSETEFVFRRPMLRAIAVGTAWIHPSVDREIRARFADSVSSRPLVAGFDLLDGDPDARLSGPQLIVELFLQPGIRDDELALLLQDLQETWRTDELVAELVDSLGVRLKPLESDFS